MFSRPIAGYVPSPAAFRIALDGFDELLEHSRGLMPDNKVTGDDASTMAAAHWATCHGHVALELSRSGPVGIDWEATLLDLLDVLHQAMLMRACASHLD